MRYKDYKYNVDMYSLLDFQANELIDIITEVQPKRICELGISNTTQIFRRYKELNKDNFNVELFSIDDNDVIELKKLETLKDNIIILPIKDETNITINNKLYNNCNIYEGFENWLSNQEKFDFIFIDGPVGFNFKKSYIKETYNYSRVQLLSFIALNKISDNCIIIYHDSERKGARETLKEFEILLDKFNFKFEKEIRCENLMKEMTIYKINKK